MKWKNLLLAVAFFSPLSCLAETQDHPTNPETWIALLPVIFFVLIIALTVIKLRRDGTKLSDLLSEKDTPVTAADTAGTTASVSRFIAFITGLVALAICVCITTFYMYCYFGNPGKTIDLSNLTNIIFGLGIGVLPYGFNKASAALKPSQPKQ